MHLLLKSFSSQNHYLKKCVQMNKQINNKKKKQINKTSHYYSTNTFPIAENSRESKKKRVHTNSKLLKCKGVEKNRGYQLGALLDFRKTYRIRYQHYTYLYDIILCRRPFTISFIIMYTRVPPMKDSTGIGNLYIIIKTRLQNSYMNSEYVHNITVKYVYLGDIGTRHRGT